MHVFTSIYIIYIYIKVTSTHARIRLRRCVQIATPSVPYFRSFTAPKPTRTNWPLHFYIYRLYSASFVPVFILVSVVVLVLLIIFMGSQDCPTSSHTCPNWLRFTIIYVIGNPAATILMLR
jgi:hypothetical protein